MKCNMCHHKIIDIFMHRKLEDFIILRSVLHLIYSFPRNLFFFFLKTVDLENWFIIVIKYVVPMLNSESKLSGWSIKRYNRNIK